MSATAQLWLDLELQCTACLLHAVYVWHNTVQMRCEDTGEGKSKPKRGNSNIITGD